MFRLERSTTASKQVRFEFQCYHNKRCVLNAQRDTCTPDDGGLQTLGLIVVLRLHCRHLQLLQRRHLQCRSTNPSARGYRQYSLRGVRDYQAHVSDARCCAHQIHTWAAVSASRPPGMLDRRGAANGVPCRAPFAAGTGPSDKPIRFRATMPTYRCRARAWVARAMLVQVAWVARARAWVASDLSEPHPAST